MNGSELELYSTDTLLQELFRRFDHGVFSGMSVIVDNKNGTGDNQAIHVWKGCSLTCAGLTVELQQKVLRQRNVDHGEEEAWQPEK